MGKLKQLRDALFPAREQVPKTRHDRAEWQRTAQEGEFDFHQKSTWRQTPDFMAQTSRLFDHFGFSPEGWAGKTIIDLGAGSMLRTRYFKGAKIIALEPLAERFLKELEWSDLRDAERVYSSPAEERIEACVGQADLVISINVLDHCYDFERIVANIAAYLAPGGLAFLSFDEHKVADEMHPLVLSDAVCRDIFAQQGLVVEKYSEGAGDVLRTYGHGAYCLNYWLRKG